MTCICRITASFKGTVLARIAKDYQKDNKSVEKYKDDFKMSDFQCTIFQAALDTIIRIFLKLVS